MVIKTFGGKHGADTKEFWDTGKSQGIPPSNLRRVAKRKLQMVNAATQLNDLVVPPGNKLEPLEDDREGQHSIRINDQYRVCFVWKDQDAYDVEVTDYH
ncbi:MAG: type II toxin-antitoxin system RelE/ParE family toxin [Candidatus Sulfotelmatobacter sp.]|jgi:proteic killer suppression protein